MANKFANLFTGALVIGGTIFGGMEALRIAEANGGIDIDQNAVTAVADFVQQRDVQEMILTENNQHVADVDCKTGEVRFLYIGDQEWLNGAEQARVITENAENDFQAGFMQMAINNGVNNVCGF